MLKGIKEIFSVPDLRKKIFYTLLLLLACRVGAHIPVPGIDGELALQALTSMTGGAQNIFQLMDVFSGGAFANMTIAALGVMPYISASIMIQLLVTILPSIQRELSENSAVAQKKLGQWTRFGTLVLAFFQSGLFARYALQLNDGTPGIVLPEILSFTVGHFNILYYLIFMTTMTAGTLLLMWVGEQITEHGVGNGISLIITIGILSSLPTTVGTIIGQLNLDSPAPGKMSLSSLLMLGFLFVVIVIGTILILNGVRKIPIQHARRVIGNREVGGATVSYLPINLNYAGVVPVIFASSIIMTIATLGQFAGRGNFIGQVANKLSPGSIVHTIMYVILIMGFTYLWTSLKFRPEDINSQLMRSGGFIPGVRPGNGTKEYLENIMSKITFLGALFLSGIAILPTIVGRVLGVDPTISYFFGGTSLLILVGAILETAKKIDSIMLERNYAGFMKTKKKVR